MSKSIRSWQVSDAVILRFRRWCGHHVPTGKGGAKIGDHVSGAIAVWMTLPEDLRKVVLDVVTDEGLTSETVLRALIDATDKYRMSKSQNKQA